MPQLSLQGSQQDKLMRLKRNVGKSQVTPCKHDLLNKLLGREAGALTRIPSVKQAFWYDLTAGDGVPVSGVPQNEATLDLFDGAVHSSRPFGTGCSPGIMLRHAAFFGARNQKPLIVNGYEIQPETWARLQSNLRRELSHQGWQQLEENLSSWSNGSALAYYHCADAKTIVPQPEARLSGSAVFIYNDPNSIAQWCLTEEFMALCPKFTTSLSTLGCNANGLKRAPRATREQWFDRTELVASALQPWHDLCLFSVGNADQWAYLISAPKGWREQVTANCYKAHEKSGIAKQPEIQWLKADPDEFRSLEKKLFLTKSELINEVDHD
jgi:hypothetical protein